MAAAHHEQNLAAAQGCARCQKPGSVCVCDRVQTFDTRLKCLILQHPQEQDLLLGSVPLLTAGLPSARRVVGLSWASLSAAYGAPCDASRWGVLYPQSLPRPLTEEEQRAPVAVVDARGRPMSARRLQGVVALDGTWSQAKTLWWRNAWLLRLPRLVVQPREPSIYGRLRREPRAGCVSTLEAVTDALVAMGEEDAVRLGLRRAFRTMVQRVRDLG